MKNLLLTGATGFLGKNFISENKESFDLIKEIGIDYAQGYWIEKPRPVAEVFPLQGHTKENSLHLVGSS